MTATRRRRSNPKPTLAQTAAGDTVWVLTVPWGVRLPDVRWYPQPGVHAYIGGKLPAHLLPYRAQPYSWEQYVQDNVNGSCSIAHERCARKTPRSDQYAMAADVAAALARYGAAILGADCGTGKTLAAIVAAKTVAPAGGTILVVVDRPTNMTVPAWRESIGGVGAGNFRWLLVSPDQVKKIVAAGKPGIRIDVAIVDEVQNFRHPSQRTRALQSALGFRGGHRPPLIAVSATLGHHPAEYLMLAPLLAAVRGGPVREWLNLGRKLEELGMPLAPDRYRPGQWDWDETAKGDPLVQQQCVDTVRSWLTDCAPPALVYRPARHDNLTVLSVPIDLTAEQRRDYELAWTQFRRENAIARSGRDSDSGRAAIMRFRQKSAFIRVDQTAQIALSQVEKGRQVVIAVEFISAAADPIAERIEAAGRPCARLYGHHDANTERLAFQRGHKRIAVLSKTSAISLHANEHLADGTYATPAMRVGILHQSRWQGILVRQTLGRTHRDGEPAIWVMPYSRDTVEESSTAVMLNRVQAATASVGGDLQAWTATAAAFGVDWLAPTDTTDE